MEALCRSRLAPRPGRLAHAPLVHNGGQALIVLLCAPPQLALF